MTASGTRQLLSTLGNTEVRVIRFGRGRRDTGGKLKASIKDRFRILASVQPIRGREREFLPDGFRQMHVIRLYVEEELCTSDDKLGQRADILEIGSESYEVIAVEKRAGLRLSHYKVFAARSND